MKTFKLLLLLFASQNSFESQSQINFTYTDLQEAGKTYITFTDTLTAVPLGTPSALAQNWDFSTLLQHYASGPTFDSTAFTAFASDFPNSNLYTYGPAIMFGGFYGGAPVSEQGMNNGYMFWRKDVTGFWTEGFRADEGVYADENVYMVPQEMILGTPTTYNTSYSNYSEWELLFNVNTTDYDTTYLSTVQKTQTADAWGSIETPTGVFPDVLRIHEYVIKVDSVFSTLLGNPLTEIELLRDTLNNYIYLANNIHYPIALVKADKNNVVKSVEYYFMQGNLGLVQKDVEKEVTVYPNPATNEIIIRLDEMNINENYHLVINDVYGNMVYSSDALQQTNLINCSDLNSGIYFYSISFGKEVKSGKIIIQ